MATIGGNLLQRTRCYYFYDTGDALQQARARQRLLGDRRRQPHARHPRRQRALHRHPPVRHVRGAGRAGRRRCTCAARAASAPSRSPTSTACPATRPQLDTTLAARRADHGHRRCRRDGFAAASRYLKLRDRASYAFALVSVAAALELDGGTHRATRASRWAASRTSPGATAQAEALLRGQRPARRSLRAGRRRCCCAAPEGYGHNDFKIELARSGHRARADAGGDRHAAVAVRKTTA